MLLFDSTGFKDSENDMKAVESTVHYFLGKKKYIFKSNSVTWKTSL